MLPDRDHEERNAKPSGVCRSSTLEAGAQGLLSWREAWLHSEFRPSLDSREEEAETGGEGTAELGSLYIFSHHPLHTVLYFLLCLLLL